MKLLATGYKYSNACISCRLYIYHENGGKLYRLLISDKAILNTYKLKFLNTDHQRFSRLAQSYTDR